MDQVLIRGPFQWIGLVADFESLNPRRTEHDRNALFCSGMCELQRVANRGCGRDHQGRSWTDGILAIVYRLHGKEQLRRLRLTGSVNLLRNYVDVSGLRR